MSDLKNEVKDIVKKRASNAKSRSKAAVTKRGRKLKEDLKDEARGAVTDTIADPLNVKSHVKRRYTRAKDKVKSAAVETVKDVGKIAIEETKGAASDVIKKRRGRPKKVR